MPAKHGVVPGTGTSEPATVPPLPHVFPGLGERSHGVASEDAFWRTESQFLGGHPSCWLRQVRPGEVTCPIPEAAQVSPGLHAGDGPECHMASCAGAVHTWTHAAHTFPVNSKLFHALGSVRSHFGNIPYCDLVMGSR